MRYVANLISANLCDVDHVRDQGKAFQFELRDVGLEEYVDLRGERQALAHTRKGADACVLERAGGLAKISRSRK